MIKSLSLILAVAFCAIVSIEAFKSSSDKEAEAYLGEFRNFDSNSDNLQDAIKEFQEENGIEATGQMTDETKSHMRKPRCGDKDKETNNKRYEPSGLKWDSGKTYSYYIQPQNHPRTMSDGEMRTAMRIGFRYWSEVAPINFRESRSTSGCMFSLSFGGRNHLQYNVHRNFRSSVDPSQYDNKASGVLAHAYFPKNGNLHFDTAETWTEGQNRGINLRIVAAHEIGHAIGLHHSKARPALMAPYYGGYVSVQQYRLPRDDIQGAQHIYGRRGVQTGGSNTGNSGSSRGSNQETLCKARNFEGIFQYSDGNLYVVLKNKAYKIVNHRVSEDKPIKMKRDITNADAMFYDAKNKQLVVFKKYQIYTVTGDLSNPKVETLEIQGKGAFNGQATAAFARPQIAEGGMQYFWTVTSDGEMLSGSLENEGREVVFSRRTRKMSEVFVSGDGSKLPTSVDAAVQFGNGNRMKLLMFTGNSYFIGLPQGNKEMQYMLPGGYPKNFKVYFGC